MAHGLPAEGGRITIAAVAFGNPTGRLRRHSLGGADLLPADPSSRSHHAATEAAVMGGYATATEPVVTVRGYCYWWEPRSAGRRGGGHNTSRQHHRAASPPVARRSRTP